jgi:hypothetical protein
VPAKETKPWSINFAPHGWVTAVNGTITLRDITSQLHESAIETLKSLEFAFMAAAEIRYKRWGILGDFIYAKTSSLSSTPRGILFSTATEDLEEFIGTFLLEYRPLEAKWGFIDALAGARVYAITSSLHLQETFFRTSHHPLRPRGRSHHRDERPNPDFALVFHQSLWRCASHSDAERCQIGSVFTGTATARLCRRGFRHPIAGKTTSRRSLPRGVHLGPFSARPRSLVRRSVPRASAKCCDFSRKTTR